MQIQNVRPSGQLRRNQTPPQCNLEQYSSHWLFDICDNAIGQLRDTSQNAVSRLSRRMWHNRTSTFAEKSGTHFFLDAIILPDSNVFFLLYLGTAHGSIGTGCRNILGAMVFTVFQDGYLIVIACDNCDSVRGGRHFLGRRSMSPSGSVHGTV